MRTIHCKCGRIIGERCLWTGPESETVLVEFIPDHMRGEVALHPEQDWSNAWSVARLERSCAESLCEQDPDFVRMAMAY